MELQRCKCFAGYQSKETGAQHDPPTCLPCPAGQYKGEDDLCSPCPPGTRSEPGSSQCDPCEVGEIQDKPNACTKCPAGSVPRQRCSLQLCSSLAAMSLQEATPSSKAASNVSRAQQVRSGVHQSELIPMRNSPYGFVVLLRSHMRGRICVEHTGVLGEP